MFRMRFPVVSSADKITLKNKVFIDGPRAVVRADDTIASLLAPTPASTLSRLYGGQAHLIAFV